MKKSLIIILITLVALACSKDYIVPGEVPSHSVVYTSETDFNNRVQINGRITFADASPGIKSRTWTFPSVVDILNSDKDDASSESIVNAVFKQTGTYEIKLSQVFNREAFVGTRMVGTTLDTTITVTVLDSVRVLATGTKLSKEGLPSGNLTISSNAKNQIEAGKFIELSPSLIGEPEVVTWILPGSATPTVTSNSPIKVKYSRVGTYDVKVIAFRNRPAGGDTLELKQLLSVIPSSDPVTLDDVKSVRSNDKQIALTYSRDLDPVGLKAGDFSVNVKNKGSQIPVNISSASLDASKPNILYLNLSSSIYNDDAITVTYTGINLRTADGIQADKFENVEMLFDNINILAGSPFDESFESSENANWPYQWWGGIWGEYNFNISNAESRTGKKSAFIEFKPNGGMIIGHKVGADVARFAAKAGKKYQIGMWIKVVTVGKNAEGKGKPDLRVYWEPATNWGVGAAMEFDEQTPLNKWVYVTAPIAEFNNDGNYQFWFRGFNENNKEAVKFYLDDLSVSEVNLRP